MSKVAIVTDSNSGITQQQARELGITVLPMPFLVDGETFLEDIEFSQEDFFEKLLGGSEISTSQPAIEPVLSLWDGLLKEHDEIVHIPTSNGLSASFETASVLAREYEGKVHVVDNGRMSVTLRQSALDAREMMLAGWSATQIKDRLEEEKFNSSVYLMVNTLQYLKKGGRITPMAAAIGTVLNLKPILQIQGEKLDSYGKARGSRQARRMLIEAMKKDFGTRFSDYSDPEHMRMQIAYAVDRDAAMDFKKEVMEVFPGFDIYVDTVSLSICCHTGPGVMGLTCSKKIEV